MGMWSWIWDSKHLGKVGNGSQSGSQRSSGASSSVPHVFTMCFDTKVCFLNEIILKECPCQAWSLPPWMLPALGWMDGAEGSLTPVLMRGSQGCRAPFPWECWTHGSSILLGSLPTVPMRCCLPEACPLLS